MKQDNADISFRGLVDFKSLVDAGIYESENAAIEETIDLLMKEKPEVRKKMAMYLYDHEKVSLGGAARIAGIPFEAMKWLLVENGIELKFGPRNYEEAREEELVAKELLKSVRNRKQHRNI